jgi:hypothetical protein
LYGPWGSGKTSLLNFLRSELEKPLKREEYPQIDTDAWVIVEFNAWQQQRICLPWWALMDAVFRQAHARLWRSDRLRAIKLWMREQFWRFRTAAIPRLVALLILALVVFGLPVAFGGETTRPVQEGSQPDNSSNLIKDINVAFGLLIAIAGLAYSISRSLLPGTARAAQTFVEIARNPMSQITQHFEDLVRWIGQPVAVFIDDLDRCEAQYVVALLESIQTLFRRALVMYVVAADTRWLRASYENVYQIFSGTISEPGHPLGHLFSEKIFQLSVPVPGILWIDKDAYWQRLVDRKEAGVEDLTDIKAEAQRKLESITSDRGVLEEVQKVKGTGLRELVYRAEAVKRLVSPQVQLSTENRLRKYGYLVGSNPRAMKRVVNAHTIQQQLLLLAGAEIDADTLPLWTILTILWPHLAECLGTNPAAVKYFQTT